MRVCIYSQILKPVSAEIINVFFKALVKKNVDTAIFKPLIAQTDRSIKIPKQFETFANHTELREFRPDLLITIGGDGTILRAATFVRDAGIPIVGINMGRLGFLASIERHYMQEAIDHLKRNEYYVEDRTMLKIECNLPLFEEIPYALNDCTILKRDTSSMITVHTYINGAFLNSYWSDGLIVSTPTGSTGYSLSCGGPIIFPGSGNFIITPVAPHNLNVRPIVISDESVITLEIEGRADTFLCSMDSRHQTVTKDHQIALSKNDFTTKLVQLNNADFRKTLSKKLIWGVDVRN